MSSEPRSQHPEVAAASSISSRSTMNCPQCGNYLPRNEGFPSWCETCGWNIELDPPKPRTGLLGRYIEQWEKDLGEQLKTELMAAGEQDLQPRLTPSVLLAFILSILVLALTPVVALLGLWIIFVNWPAPWAMAGGCMLLALSFVLRPRLSRKPKNLLSSNEVPELRRLVQDVASHLKLKCPEDIVLTPEFNAAMGVTGLGRRPCLTIGLPLWWILSDEEQIALVSHELGHLCNGDPTHGLIMGNAIATLDTWHYLFDWSEHARDMSVSALIASPFVALLAQILNLIGAILRLLVFRESQRSEFLADDIAARIAGTEPVVDLLIKTGLGRHLPAACDKAQFGGDTLGRTSIQEFGKIVQGAPHREYERLRLEAQRDHSRVDSTHPPTGHRIALLKRWHRLPVIALTPAQSNELKEEILPFLPKASEKIMAAYFPD